MFDADAPAAYNEVRHWLVMNIPESDVKNGDEVAAYLGSGTRSGIHRYIFLVFKQLNGKVEHNEPRSAKWYWQKNNIQFEIDLVSFVIHFFLLYTLQELFESI